MNIHGVACLNQPVSVACLQYEQQEEIERNLDILEGRDPDAPLGKVPLQPSGKQNTASAAVVASPVPTAVGNEDDKVSVTTAAAAVSSDGSAGGAAVPALAGSFDVLPRDTDGRVSEENDPLGAAAMDMGPSDPVRPLSPAMGTGICSIVHGCSCLCAQPRFLLRAWPVGDRLLRCHV